MTCSQWQLCTKWVVNIVNEKQCICCFHKALRYVQYFWITFITLHIFARGQLADVKRIHKFSTLLPLEYMARVQYLQLTLFSRQ